MLETDFLLLFHLTFNVNLPDDLRWHIFGFVPKPTPQTDVILICASCEKQLLTIEDGYMRQMISYYASEDESFVCHECSTWAPLKPALTPPEIELHVLNATFHEHHI